MFFLRQNEPNIRRYLPSFIFSDKTADAIARANNSEHEALRLAVADVANQFYVEKATWGLTIWERILDIPTVISDGYEIRRKRILLKLQSTQTSTLEFMNVLLNRYTTDGKGYIAERNAEYAFDIVVDVDTVKNWREISRALYLYKPAHLGMYFIMQIMQIVKVRHYADFRQFVEARHCVYNLGSARTTRWDGEFRLDGTIRLDGIYPDALYREQLQQKAVIEGLSHAWHRIPFEQLARGEHLSETRQGVQILQSADGTNTTGPRLAVNTKQKSEVLQKINSYQHSSHRLGNLMDGGFCWDGSHRLDGARYFDGHVNQCCTVAAIKKGKEGAAEPI